MTGQQLKNSILQMAVQGKLVPQDPNDEPASVLLERIRKEKEQLIKEGKIKEEKNSSYIFRDAPMPNSPEFQMEPHQQCKQARFCQLSHKANYRHHGRCKKDSSLS